MEKNLNKKVNDLNERIHNLSSDLLPERIYNLDYCPRYRNRDSKFLMETISKIDIPDNMEPNKFYDYIEEKFSDFFNVLTKREKLFILEYVEKFKIDLTDKQVYKLIDQIGENLIHENFYYYVKALYEQTYKFDIEFWKQMSKDKNFLDFITTFYRDEEHIFMAYSKNEFTEFYETLCYAKEKVPELKPYFEKVVKQVIEHGDFSYPFYPFSCRNIEYLKEYIVNQDKLTDEEKNFALNYRTVNNFNSFSLPILVSSNFSLEEKLRVLEEDDFDYFINRTFYLQVFGMREYMKDEYESIDVVKLFNLDKDEMTSILDEVIDENKVPATYTPYYSYGQYHRAGWFKFKEGQISADELKRDYITNFVQFCECLKEINILKPYEVDPLSKVIKVTDSYGDKHNDVEQDVVFKKKPQEKVFRRQRIMNFIHPNN